MKIWDVLEKYESICKKRWNQIDSINLVVEFCPDHVERSHHCRHAKVKKNRFTLILFAFFPLQGFYVFAVYFVMHNQLCWPTKASYTVEMSGQDGPEPPYQGGGPTTIGGDISKSTQNLISAMEEVSAQHTAACVHATTFTRRRKQNNFKDATFFFFFKSCRKSCVCHTAM